MQPHMVEYRPKNPAVRVWPRLGFINCPGDAIDGDVLISRSFKGPGKHRAIFEKLLWSPLPNVTNWFSRDPSPT